ncbi:heterokaryon incompatibility protein [Stagonosporopsis vannaccii]|nr:heterokaryon incompatibility protein [Stagonosporopsis vannaccii]
MDPILDHEATVTPYQLCGVCEPIVTFYLSKWDVMEHVSPIRTTPKSIGLTAERLLGPLSSFRKQHASVDDMRSAAAQGCHLCTLLIGKPGAVFEKPDQQLYVGCDVRRAPAYVTLFSLAEPENPTSWTSTESLEVRRVLNGATQETGSRISALCQHESAELQRPVCFLSTGSSVARKMMATWLRQCKEGHASCNERLEHGAPTRLLDLEAFTACKDLRLVCTTDTGGQEYAALSYCWGHGVTTKLRTSNLVEFASRIPITQLSKTVVEAVEVCRGLNIRYLWVDALCIMQEDNEDFAHEVSRMGSIYAGALITVAAADSEHCHSGIYRRRTPLSQKDLVIEGHGVTLDITSRAYECNNHDGWLSNTLLSYRGWAYQERVMAPRTIHFDRNEIVWECRERTFCPRCADEAHLQPDDYDSAKRVFKELHPSSKETATESTFHLLWFGIVHLYNRTNLSDENDRLSALAGIAQLIYHRLGYEASHGLWLPIFFKELMWHSTLVMKERRRDQDHCASVPSWAWTASPFTISYSPKSYGAGRELYCCTITKLPQPTPFGQLSSLPAASFRVRAWLTRCRAVLKVKTPSPNYWTLAPSHDLSAGPWKPPQSPNVPAWRYYLFPDGPDMVEQDVVCLTMRRIVDDARVPFDGPLAWTARYRMADFGLVLSVVDADKKVYKRIGYFETLLYAEQEWTQEEEEVEIV